MACLFILHYHYRPGGVRSVVERFLFAWARAGRWQRVILAGGEAPDPAWLESLRKACGRVEVRVDAALGYHSESPIVNVSEMRKTLNGWISETRPDLLWVHNLSVGRNLRLGEAVRQLGVPMLCHHHDWWVQHRWERWQEFSLDSWEQAAAAILPDGPEVRHACAHPADAALLGNYFGERVAWIVPPMPPAPAEISPCHHREPYWLAPCRILRRKNLLEALLLTRWHRPHGRLLISGSVSSAAEAANGRAVQQAADMLGLSLEIGAATHSSMDDLYRHAEMVLQTSVQEGFGLTSWEAGVHHRPLLLRCLSGLTEAFEHSGAAFPGAYHEVLLPATFLTPHERQLQAKGWVRQCAYLPEPWRSQAALLAEPAREGLIAFSSLTVTGQLEILRDWDRLESALREHNPWLDHPEIFQPATPALFLESGLSSLERLLTHAAPARTTSAAEVVSALLDAAIPNARHHPLLW